jgi:hypothetical protein
MPNSDIASRALLRRTDGDLAVNFMSHKKTADDNPQINFCGYPLILLSELGFQKALLAHFRERGLGGRFWPRLMTLLLKERSPSFSVPS